MKIAVCSDLHLEFGNIKLKNTENADVLILSGDICVARDLMHYEPHVDENLRFSKSDIYHEFFGNCVREFPTVFYVAGNHEHYHGDFVHTISDLKSKLGYLKNLHILDKETFVLDDVTFIGGTLWTDMNKEDPVTLTCVARMMNDFRCVTNSSKKVSYKVEKFAMKPDGSGEYLRDSTGRFVVEKLEFKQRDAKFSTHDAVQEHKKMLDYIKIVTENNYDKKYVVVGHHTPSPDSIHPRYADDSIMNGGYTSDLREFILSRPQIKLWTHGHTHELFDYMIGSTRVVCNPRGYDGYEDMADRFEMKYVEV
jgi:Icc-related predicted phosphoesterase